MGTILGRVTDNSGAVVPNAKVTFRNEATGVSNVTETNGVGEYVVSNLIPGAYEITVSQQGFSLFTVNHVELSVSQTVREDAQLAVGANTTSVSVTASAPLVQTDTSSVESVINSKQIETMPLDGRQNVFGLLSLAPGVQGGAWGMYVPKFGANTVEGSYNVRIDGTDASESENEYIGIGDPSFDAIAEFKVIDSMGSAKYGNGSASVIMVTKSGTNQFHGTAFEYNRIKELAAQNFFATGLPKSPYIRNEFGGSFGGPIKKDKLFFFGSYEGLTFRSSQTSESNMPTPALLQGDFSALPAGSIIDPSTGQPFAGNIIPPDRISTAAQFFNKFFDTPNLATTAAGGLGTNYVINLRSVTDEFRYEGRGDYNINSKNQLSGMWFDARYVPRTGPGWSSKFGGWTNPATYQNVAINWTSTIKPTLTNLASFGFHRVWDKFASQTAGTVDMHSLFPQLP
ncbi:MAG TPA: carboxypeptidase-like regulatory domain-containing protein, partial [Terriglobia bacterium]|nr:carboxypeptidase-like regulatory domain-containing protein [Terriglobia bacterium]